MFSRSMLSFLLLAIVVSVAHGQNLIAEPPESKGYRVNVVSALEKVFREDDFAADVKNGVQLAGARNEYLSFQLVVEAPWRVVNVGRIQFTDFDGPGGAKIPASIARWNRVEYVQTTLKPLYQTPRGLGWYPDPLLRAGPFTVPRLSRVPIWVTLKTPKNCPAGDYHGRIDVIIDGHASTAISVALKIWDFALSDATHLRTMTWLSSGNIRSFYGIDDSAGEQRTSEAMENYERMLLEHRLGPGGEIASDVPRRGDGSYDFSRVDATLSRLIDGGMNAFIIGTAPNLERLGRKEYSAKFLTEFPAMIQAYTNHLRQKGWSDLAYVYTYDEAPAEAWPQVRRVASAVKELSPQAKIFQCLNQPAGVAALTGTVDVFDVYVAQYHKAGVAEAQKHGAQAWLALCCYPADHPNFFIEYSLVDIRATPWICWKYGAQGFEYWSPNSWGVNSQGKGDRWPKAAWVGNAFKRYNGDGYLLYPGEQMQPYSSIRLEALRDGLQDYEYLWMLSQLVDRAASHGHTDVELSAARRLLSLTDIVSESGKYPTDPASYQRYREELAEAITRIATLN